MHPHLIEEKSNPYATCPSGGPLIQHSLVIMLEFYRQGKISLEKIVEKMAHNPAILYRIDKRGFIREGYHADLVLLTRMIPGPFQRRTSSTNADGPPLKALPSIPRVISTIVNGNIVYQGRFFNEDKKGERLMFNVQVQ